jgi:replicative DNA helicase
VSALLAESSIGDGGIIGCEEALIGCILVAQPGTSLAIAELPNLTAYDFFLERHRLLWEAIEACWQRDKDARLSVVVGELKNTGHLESVGIENLLREYLEGVAHVPVYLGPLAKQIREASVRRATKELVANLFEQALAEGLTPEAAMRQAQALFDGIPRDSMEDLDPAVEWLEDLDAPKAPVGTGLSTLDASAMLMPGELVVVGGRTSHGKTAFCTAIAWSMAESGHRVAYITLEDSGQQIVRRIQSIITGIRSERLLSPATLSEPEFAAADAAIRRIQDSGLMVFDLLRLGSSSEETVLRAVQTIDAEVVFVDYLQRISSGNRQQNRVYGLESICNGLQTAAAKLGRVVIAGCQLSRGVDQDGGRTPILTDLRDSGAIEQTARQVWLLYWPWKQNQEEYEASHYELIVAKQSKGKTGAFGLKFDASTGRFAET